MRKLANLIVLGSIATLAPTAHAGQTGRAATTPTPGAERFEVTGIKAVRPTLVKTIAALEKRDAAVARAAFDEYDSAWNGIEVYINTRSKEMYGELEHKYQKEIADGACRLRRGSRSSYAPLFADAQAMLAKYDEAIHMVETAAPLNRFYDDVARLRIVRAHLRKVNPALKEGNLAKARTSFAAFNDNWDSIEDLVKARSADAYTAIEKGMIDIERALMPEKPNVEQVTALVTGVMDKYNAIVAEVTKDARAKK